MNRFIQVKDCVLIVLATILIVLSTINHMKLLDNTSTDYKVIENVQENGQTQEHIKTRRACNCNYIEEVNDSVELFKAMIELE